MVVVVVAVVAVVVVVGQTVGSIVAIIVVVVVVVVVYSIIHSRRSSSSSGSSSSSSSSRRSSSSTRTDRWVHFQQNAGLRLFVPPRIVQEFCTASRIDTNSDIWGIFCPVFVQAVIERVPRSAAYNFIW